MQFISVVSENRFVMGIKPDFSPTKNSSTTTHMSGPAKSIAHQHVIHGGLCLFHTLRQNYPFADDKIIGLNHDGQIPASRLAKSIPGWSLEPVCRDRMP